MWPFGRRAARRSGAGADGIKPRRPHAGQLRREQRALLGIREEKLRDLGGLLVELYRRGSFREDLLAEACAELVGIDARLVEIDDLLHANRRVPRCTCGAPVLRGSHFCANCGRLLDSPAGGGGGEDTVIVSRKGS